MDFNKSSEKNLPSTTELFSSAKVVAEAAQAAFGSERDKIAKDKVADAAADLLGAVSHYGHLEEKGVGEYVRKAQNYLHDYNSSQSTTNTTTGTDGSNSVKPPETAPTTTEGHNDGNKYSQIFKMAEGFLK